MYACVCHGITESKIRELIVNDKMTTMREITKALGIGRCCGKCLPHIRKLLIQINSENHNKT